MAVMPVGAAVRYLAEKDPDRPAVTEVPVEGTHVTSVRTLTRMELEKRTNRLARTYERLGVTEGSFVTIGLPNGVDFYEACIAAWKSTPLGRPMVTKLPSVTPSRS